MIIVFHGTRGFNVLNLCLCMWERLHMQTWGCKTVPIFQEIRAYIMFHFESPVHFAFLLCIDYWIQSKNWNLNILTQELSWDYARHTEIWLSTILFFFSTIHDSSDYLNTSLLHDKSLSIFFVVQAYIVKVFIFGEFYETSRWNLLLLWFKFFKSLFH